MTEKSIHMVNDGKPQWQNNMTLPSLEDISINLKNQGDRRSRRTVLTLQKSLLNLLLEKPLSEITVRELTDRADISRTTFYLHYRNISELFQSIEDEVVLQYQKTIQDILVNEDNSPTADHETNMQRLRRLLELAFQFFYEHPTFCTVFFQNPESHFFQRTIGSGFDTVTDVMDQLNPYLSPLELRYSYYFVVNGMRGVIREWQVKGFKESPQEISDLLWRFILDHWYIKIENR